MTGLLNARRERRVADAVIRSPEEHTVMAKDGAVRSIQSADVTVPAEDLEPRWNATHLERLARTYWKYLSRVTLGLIRVTYTETERQVVLLGRPFVLLRFAAPEYEVSRGRGIVRWRIIDGLLVSKRGRNGDGYLEIDVRRHPPEEEGWETVHIEVEVASFYPAIATWLTASSTRTRSRRSTCSSRTASCARWRASTSRSRRSGASPTRSSAACARSATARSRSATRRGAGSR